MTFSDKLIYFYENITPFQAAMVVGVLVLYVSYLLLRDMGVPPGPKGLPLFGYWPFLKSDETCHLHIQDLGKKYGDVYSFRVAGTLLIRLGSLKAIREAFITNSESFTTRYQISIIEDAFGGGLLFLNGEHWKVLRKFFVAKFKDFGMNSVKENAVGSVYDALMGTVEDLKATKGQPIDVNGLVNKKAITVFRRIVFNDEGITEEELQAVNGEYREVMKGLTSTNLMLIGPFAKYCMFPFMKSVSRVKKNQERIVSILLDVIRRHKSEYDESNTANLVYAYFKEKEDRRKKGDTTAEFFTDKALLDTLNQLMADGLQTLAAFIGNMIALLVQYPSEQEKIYEEIVDVVGTERLPSLEDKTKLTYTNAFIYEASRYTDFFPLLPSVQCTKETTIQGYKIPEGSVAVYDFYSAHRNPNDFENPDEFNPLRYVPHPGQKRPDLPIVFGIGKRSCIGEGFSMTQTFLFLTTIVQNFRLSLPKDAEASSTMFASENNLIICAHLRSHSSRSK